MKDVHSFRNKESISIKHLNTVNNMSLHLTCLKLSIYTNILYLSIQYYYLKTVSNVQTKNGNTYEYNYKHGLSLARCGAHCCTL